MKKNILYIASTTLFVTTIFSTVSASFAIGGISGLIKAETNRKTTRAIVNYKTEEETEKPVRISGQISSNADSTKLVIGYWEDYITGYASEYKFIRVPLDKQRNFSISLPKINHPYRIIIADAVSSNTLVEQQIVEPGDDIYLAGIIKDQPEYSDTNFMAHYSGVGSAKYECMQALKTIKDDTLSYTNVSLYDKIKLADSISFAKFEILKHFKNRIKPEIYSLMEIDIIGKLNHSLLSSSFSDIINSKKATVSNGDVKLFNELTKRRTTVPDKIIAQSNSYLAYLYLKEKLKLLFKYQGRNFGLKDIYIAIKDDYSDELREKLFCTSLLNAVDITLFFGGCDAEDYKFCLKDAAEQIHTPWLKQRIENLLHSRTKGVEAFEFRLSADSSNEIVKLSDFREKVVLIEMWGYICTGCYRFSNAFHDKVFPQFKNNSDFKVLSIMLDEYAGKDKYLSRLRRIEKPYYTSPDYINLYAGKNEQMGRNIEEHYKIDGVPFILLVDKKGKIYSSTIPFFTDSDSPNTEKLSTLIREALAQ